MSWGPRSVDGGLDEIVVEGRRSGIWLCGKRVPGPDPEAALARLGREPGAIVCLCQEHEIDERYPDYLAWLTANEGRRALWRPVPDLSAPTLDEARELAAEVNRLRDAGWAVVIHCGAGLGRAPTIAICALLDRGHELDVVLDAVAQSRPMAGPESGHQRELVEALGGRR
ncbi:MAG: dual specificity protein phosphatase family protein [Acidimicrobiia bacterium]|nr:dual specificity protein phosphatase family protein [Acidimicrobiia bacterium]